MTAATRLFLVLAVAAATAANGGKNNDDDYPCPYEYCQDANGLDTQYYVSPDDVRRFRQQQHQRKRNSTKAGACVVGYCLTPGYKKMELPHDPGSNKTHVRMNLEVLEVLTIDDKKFSVTVNMYFGVFWHENRLRITEDAPKVVSWLPIDMEFMKNLWIPNVFIYNLVSFHALEVLQELAGLWIVEDKTLHFNLATHVTFMCPMRFEKFPLDEHTCLFRVGSSNYDETRMTFANEKLSYNQKEGNTILDYQVTMIPLRENDTIVEYGEAGSYSVTGFEMTLTRNVAKYLYIYYLPSGLFVVVSWSSFLIPPEVVPGRMALLVTLFLVLINIFNTITNVSPNVEGMTAISSWMIACMFFVFGALCGYSGLLYFLLVRKQHGIEKKRRDLTTVHSKDCELHPNSEPLKLREELGSLDQSEFLAKIDSTMLKLFPIMFFLFNVAYWPYWTML